jgi:hypothetical protein
MKLLLFPLRIPVTLFMCAIGAALMERSGMQQGIHGW